jgi:DNA ligase (NAD+)
MEVSALIYELDFSREIQPTNDKLKNIKFCITGSFSIPRDKIREKLESCGAKFVNSVSSKTDILFCGNNAGSKLNKAKKLGIKVLNEDELIKKIQEGNW